MPPHPDVPEDTWQGQPESSNSSDDNSKVTAPALCFATPASFRALSAQLPDQLLQWPRLFCVLPHPDARGRVNGRDPADVLNAMWRWVSRPRWLAK